MELESLPEVEVLPEVEAEPPVTELKDELLSLCEDVPENCPWKFSPETDPVVSTVYWGPWVRVADNCDDGELEP